MLLYDLTCKTQLGLPHAFASSGFVAQINAEACTGCGICADDRCPMGAIVLSDHTSVLTHEKCIGCGLCVSVCPGEAITSGQKRRSARGAGHDQDLGVKVLGEKGRLEGFLKQMKP